MYRIFNDLLQILNIILYGIKEFYVPRYLIGGLNTAMFIRTKIFVIYTETLNAYVFIKKIIKRRKIE